MTIVSPLRSQCYLQLPFAVQTVNAVHIHSIFITYQSDSNDFRSIKYLIGAVHCSFHLGPFQVAIEDVHRLFETDFEFMRFTILRFCVWLFYWMAAVPATSKQLPNWVFLIQMGFVVFCESEMRITLSHFIMMNDYYIMNDRNFIRFLRHYV